MGSKNRIARDILKIILKNRKYNQWYVEPFCGGCNVIDKVDGNRLANDSNKYLISMFNKIVYDGWVPPDFVDEKTHSDVKAHPEDFEECFVAFVRFGASFGADWNGGYARNVRKDNPDAEYLNRTSKSYSKQSKNNIMNQLESLKGVVFTSKNYLELDIPENSIVYCDPHMREPQNIKMISTTMNFGCGSGIYLLVTKCLFLNTMLQKISNAYGNAI
jgi:DNA adenine methylase